MKIQAIPEYPWPHRVRASVQKTIEGVPYQRLEGEPFWMPTEKGKGQYQCECGGDAFRLWWKDYDTVAQCVKCGAAQSVHSG